MPSSNSRPRGRRHQRIPAFVWDPRLSATQLLDGTGSVIDPGRARLKIDRTTHVAHDS